MAKLLSLLVVVYSCACAVFGQNLANLMTIQPGTTNGGCGARTALLNQYATESLQSLNNAINAIDTHGSARTPRGQQVRRAITTFFKQSSPADRNAIRDNLVFVRNWFQGTLTGIPPAETYLFCDSSFLVQKAVTDQAQDYQGAGIVRNGQNVPISTAYAANLAGGNVPWWAGTHTTPAANGYYFTDATSGGGYCNTVGHDGITANLNLFVANPNGPPTQHAEYSTVVLCPDSFTRADRPDTWPAGSNQIRAGDSLQTALPKCTTLLHEAFHLIFGAGPSPGMLEGNAEFYTLAQCANTNKSKDTLRRNPESYIYFIASMYYLLGTAPAIPTNWDFTNRPDRART